MKKMESKQIQSLRLVNCNLFKINIPGVNSQVSVLKGEKMTCHHSNNKNENTHLGLDFKINY